MSFLHGERRGKTVPEEHGRACISLREAQVFGLAFFITRWVEIGKCEIIAGHRSWRLIFEFIPIRYRIG